MFMENSRFESNFGVKQKTVTSQILLTGTVQPWDGMLCPPRPARLLQVVVGFLPLFCPLVLASRGAGMVTVWGVELWSRTWSHMHIWTYIYTILSSLLLLLIMIITILLLLFCVIIYIYWVWAKPKWLEYMNPNQLKFEVFLDFKHLFKLFLFFKSICG